MTAVALQITGLIVQGWHFYLTIYLSWMKIKGFAGSMVYVIVYISHLVGHLCGNCKRLETFMANYLVGNLWLMELTYHCIYACACMSALKG